VRAHLGSGIPWKNRESCEIQGIPGCGTSAVQEKRTCFSSRWLGKPVSGRCGSPPQRLIQMSPTPKLPPHSLKYLSYEQPSFRRMPVARTLLRLSVLQSHKAFSLPSNRALTMLRAVFILITRKCVQISAQVRRRGHQKCSADRRPNMHDPGLPSARSRCRRSASCCRADDHWQRSKSPGPLSYCQVITRPPQTQARAHSGSRDPLTYTFLFSYSRC